MYFDARRNRSDRSQFWGIAYVDDQVLVTTNPDKYIGEVDVMLAETGSSIRIALADWEDWLGGEWSESCDHQIEAEALAVIIPLLRSKLPTVEAVVAAAGMEMEVESEAAEEDGMVARILHEMACQKLAGRAMAKGVACPRCGMFSTDYEYVRLEQVSESGPQSHLVCHECGKEFGPADV
jgi:hypothetical protein